MAATYYVQYKSPSLWQWHLCDIAGNGWFDKATALDAAEEQRKRYSRTELPIKYRLLSTGGDIVPIDD